MTKRSRARRTVTVGVALSLAAAPTLAAGPIPPGFIWIDQAAAGNGAGNAGAGMGTGAGGTAGTGNSVGAAGTTGSSAGTGAAAPGNATGATGIGGNTGVGNIGAGQPGTISPGSPAGTNATGTNTTGTDTTNGGTSGTTGAGSSQNGTNNTGAGTTGVNGTAGGSLGSVPVSGGTGGIQTYTLGQAIQAGLQSSADIQTATRNVEIDRKRADEAAAEARPNVGASGTAFRYDQATSIKLGSGPAIQVTPAHQEILQFSVGDKLDLTGQIRAASDQARLQSLADEFILGQLRNARILRAQTIFFNTLRAQHQVEVAQAALTNAQQQFTNASQLNAAGVGQKIDVLRAQTQVATARQNVNAAANNLSIAVSSFNDLAGRPLDAPVRLEDTPGVVFQQPVTDFSAVGAATLNAAAPLPNAPGEVAAIDVTQALQAANAQRPEILTAQVNVRVAQTGIKLARAGQEPTFSLNAAGDYYPTPSFQFPRQRTATLTATLNIPLYDGGATRDRVQEARMRTENAQTSLESTRSDVALDVRQAYLNLATASQQIDAANTALQSAIAARQLAELRYRGQVGLYLEVTDAQAALVQAENAQVDAVYNYLVARAQFQNAVGTPQAL